VVYVVGEVELVVVKVVIELDDVVELGNVVEEKREDEVDVAMLMVITV
jgi:hypothetical protein